MAIGTLCGTSLSPFVERVVLTAALKGKPEAIIQADPPGGMKSDAHFAANPMGKIPVFILEDGTALSECQVIADYVDATIEGPSILGENALDRAKIATLCRVVDLYFADAFSNLWPGRNQPDDVKKQAAEEDIPKAMDYLEHYAAKGFGLVSGKTNMADAALFPWMLHMKVFGKPYGLQDFGDRPALSAWLTATRDLPHFKDSFARSSAALRAVS